MVTDMRAQKEQEHLLGIETMLVFRPQRNH